MLNNSSGNFFTIENLDRLVKKRTDNKWITKKLKDPETLFFPVWREKNLFNVDSGPRIVFFSQNDISNIKVPIGSPTLIGNLNGKTYFSFLIPDKIEETESAFSEFGIFSSIRKYGILLPKDEAALLGYANAISNWQKHHQFCGQCGNKTQIADAGHRLVCSNKNCSHQSFPRTDPAIITLIYKDDKCLLVRQSHWQPVTQYALVAGFVEPGESLESAVARETYEETGIELDDIKYFSAQPWPFPGSIMLGFFARAVTEKITFHDGEIEAAKWMTRKNIKESLLNKTLKTPTGFSIAYRLIETWFNKESDEKLSDIISQIK